MNRGPWLFRWTGAMPSYDCRSYDCMMTSSNENIFRVTGPLCGEFTGTGEFPAQRPVTRSFRMFSLICVWVNGWVNNREAGDLRRYRAHYDVTLIVLAIASASKVTLNNVDGIFTRTNEILWGYHRHNKTEIDKTMFEERCARGSYHGQG